MISARVDHEVAYGKLQVQMAGGKLWYWETPAGKKRWTRRVRMLTSHITQDMEVLEIGCGPGYFTQEIAKTKAKITAIDISPDFLDIARQRVPSTNTRFKLENAYDLSFVDNTFHSIVGSSVLHHLEIDQALQEFYRVLKPGGNIYFTEPNMLNPHVFLMMKVPVIRKLSCIAPDETAFIKWILKKKLLKAGFKGIRVTPFDFLHPLTPRIMIPMIEKTGLFVERIPFLREISGSLYIEAKKIQS